jgi:hypothetical protein
MAVTLVLSKTLGGSAVSDSLAGGGSGIDLGSVVNKEYCPIISKSSNTGWQALYIKHNATIDPIVDVGTYIEEFSQTYGGAQTAALDYTAMQAKGNASDNSPNNGNDPALGSGLRIEHDADLGGSLGLSAFDGTRAQVKIYGKSGNGVSLSTAFPLHVDACIWNNSGTPVDATTPVTGKIGKTADTVLGDTAFVKLRYYLEETASDGGIIQWDWVIKYSYTA